MHRNALKFIETLEYSAEKWKSIEMINFSYQTQIQFKESIATWQKS